MKQNGSLKCGFHKYFLPSAEINMRHKDIVGSIDTACEPNVNTLTYGKRNIQRHNIYIYISLTWKVSNVPNNLALSKQHHYTPVRM